MSVRGLKKIVMGLYNDDGAKKEYRPFWFEKYQLTILPTIKQSTELSSY